MTTAGDVAAVRHTLKSVDPRVRSGAIEYLDNLLSGQVRKRVMLLVEEVSLAEQIRKGNVIFRTRTRDVEDTVAQLLHDEDEVIASAAVLLVETCGLWSLADDLEYVLAHRDVRDQHVFEAASWAMAASRMEPETRRNLWQEALPSVELADRLRRVPLFDFTSIENLFRLARLGRQVRYEPGRVLYERGLAPDALQILLDGQTQTDGPDGPTTTAPETFAFAEVLEGAPMQASITAKDRAITLAITQDELLTLLSEQPGLTSGLFRLVIRSRGLGAGQPVVAGAFGSGFAPDGRGEVRAVDRLLALQGNPFFAGASSEAMWRLSHAARPVTLAAGGRLLPPGESAIAIVLTGSILVQPAGATERLATAGDMIGVYETLGGTDLDAAITIAEPVTVLKIDRAELFDVLADHSSLMQELFSRLMRQS
jgi:CRP-like cAMP-binding protein